MASSNYLTNVAIVGAGGHCGVGIVEALLKTGKHTISALSRADSTSKLPDGVHVKKVDYQDPSSLVEALRGQDVLIITMAVRAPGDTQEKLIRAAAEANVPWILPNYWGSQSAQEYTKQGPNGDMHQKALQLIEKLGKSSHISVHSSFWYEWSLPFPPGFGFDIAKREVTLYDEGETKMVTSTFPQVGRAVASLLSLPVHADGPSIDDFKNARLYIRSFYISQKEMLQSVLRVTNTSIDDWKVSKEPVEQRLADGNAELKAGNYHGFAKALYARGFFTDGLLEHHAQRVSNDALGLPKEDLDEATKAAIARGPPF